MHPRKSAVTRLMGIVILVLLPSCSPEQTGTSERQRSSALPNIILLSIDTLRADRLSCYGNPRDTSPWIDRIASQGIRFKQVLSQSPDTAPSHMTIFTSTFPLVHGVYQVKGQARFKVLPESLPTLTENLKEAGYRTAAFTGGAQITAGFGFERGFEIYNEDLYQLEWEDFQPVLDWLERPVAGNPFFLFLHTYEVHSPYCPPPPYNEMYDPTYEGDFPEYYKHLFQFDENSKHQPLTQRDFEHLSALYDGEIRYTDDLLGRFFEILEKRGFFGNEKTLLIITSDHGEEFKEHGKLNHTQLYLEVMEVPLIFHWPGKIPENNTIMGQARLIDVAPTILDLIDLKIPSHTQGASLKPFILSGGEVELNALSDQSYFHAGRFAYRSKDWTLYQKGKESVELYSRVDDQDEQHNLLEDKSASTDFAKTVKNLQKKMRDLLSGCLKHRKGLNIKKQTTVHPGGLDELKDQTTRELEERLRALGYIK